VDSGRQEQPGAFGGFAPEAGQEVDERDPARLARFPEAPEAVFLERVFGQAVDLQEAGSDGPFDEETRRHGEDAERRAERRGFVADGPEKRERERELRLA
jgi:hypothetical protein